MLVQGFDDGRLRYDFDPSGPELRELDPCRDVTRSHLDVRGLFQHLGGALVVVYRHDDKVWLSIDRQRLPLTDAGTSLEWIPDGSLRTLTWRRDDATLAEISYRIAPDLDDVGLTPHVEDEDADFGLFLVNLASDRGRLSRIFSGAG